jgi:hypothetical protein
VTLDSPKARPPGDFNWGETLWHELAHVFTIQMSKQRVPRWLTEGISVWEERRARPEWGREMDITFAHALNEGKVMKLDVLNQGFQDPKMISLAYYQASLVVDHIVETYGEPKLHAMLRAYGEGLEDETAIKEGLGASLAQLQTGFDARLDKQYAALRLAIKTPEMKEKMSVEELKALAASNPDSFAVQMRSGAGPAGSQRQRRRDCRARARGSDHPRRERRQQPTHHDREDCPRAEGHGPCDQSARSGDAHRITPTWSQRGSSRSSSPRSATPHAPKMPIAGWWRSIRSMSTPKLSSDAWRSSAKTP